LLASIERKRTIVEVLPVTSLQTKTFFVAGTPTEGEEDFIATVMMNDAFWERILAGQN
jgi:hypothetical protein